MWRSWDDGLVLIAYIDESYEQDSYFIGAAIATQGVWERVAEGYEAVRACTASRHAIPTGAEFHGHEIMGGRGD